MKNISQTNKKYIGIEILRALLCFWIVLFHCAKYKKSHYKYFWRLFHVPTFFLLSFYFYYQIIHGRMIEKIKIRFERLLIPYFLWPIIIFFINNIFLKTFIIDKTSIREYLKYLFTQFIFGKGIHGIFWFQNNLIFLSLLFSIISLLFKNNFMEILHFLSSLSLYLHYSGKSYDFFKFTKYKNSLGTLIELIPLAILGFTYKYINLLSLVNKLPVYIKCILCFYIYFLFEYDIFLLPIGFRYPNIILYIIASSIFLILFGSLNFERFKINIIINIITKCTGGIYYIHPFVRNNLEKYFIFFKKRTYTSASLIYVISYIICMIGSKHLQNNKLKYLFM